jgi:Flp pilus assembly protein TadG
MSKPCFRRFYHQQQGGVIVEFALVLSLLLLLVFGAIDLGHAYYIKQVIIGASREGARYASRYQTDGSGNHITPNMLTPSVQNFILNRSADNSNRGGYGLRSMLPADASPGVTPAGSGFTTGAAGTDLTVTVTARKNWFLLGVLVPGLGSYVDLSVTTDMKVE